jgi:hypothetical protein
MTSEESGSLARPIHGLWRQVRKAPSLGVGHAGQYRGRNMALAPQVRCRNVATTPLTIRSILRWADAHHERRGRWPRHQSRVVPEAPGENWGAISHALLVGDRGLPGGTSLAGLLFRKRGVPLPRHRGPRLSVRMILAKADRHHRRTGRWPTANHCSIPGTAGWTWSALDCALRRNELGSVSKLRFSPIVLHDDMEVGAHETTRAHG